MGLSVQGLRKRFGDVVALDGCNLIVDRGQLIGFLGPNGAGKTTTMRAILGLLSVDSGTITWDGEPMGIEHRRRVGYLPQERGLYQRMTLRSHVTYIGRLAGLDPSEAQRRADHWIERVGLTERHNDRVQDLSVGNQQRVQLAVALIHEPELLVLDEPFAGLDPVAVASLSEILLAQVAAGRAVVFSSHQLDLVQDFCRQVTILVHGRTVASGQVDDLRDASPRRRVRIRWAGEAPDWVPSEALQGVNHDRNISRFEVAAGTDPTVTIAEAATQARIVAVTFEPPPLDSVFLDLVSA